MGQGLLVVEHRAKMATTALHIAARHGTLRVRKKVILP